MIHAVVFDVGETLVDETEVWGRWADWLGVPRHTFSAVLGAMIAQGRPHWDGFRLFRPDFDPEAEDRKRIAAGRNTGFGPEDLYPDARPCLEALRASGVWVGIAANQPARAEKDLHACELPVEMVGISEIWGLRKPDAAFFERVLTEVPHAAGEILYVGDRIDKDVAPAKRAGMQAAWIRRGAWGLIAEDGSGGPADVRLDSLDELPGWVAAQRCG
ncbi:HAD family hydrolase [Streptomyces sp. 8N706]|uniref:HAD family hydrolase n=1 Tax=Streptomyces sp. 8N706 TaxID=3457416 RepID=UPI003FD21FBE